MGEAFEHRERSTSSMTFISLQKPEIPILVPFNCILKINDGIVVISATYESYGDRPWYLVVDGGQHF
jgi:hypothetical protein